MISIRPILFFPLTAHNALHINLRGGENLFKRLLKLTYNVVIPPVVAVLAAAVSIVGVVLACLVNVIALPFQAIYNALDDDQSPESKPLLLTPSSTPFSPRTRTTPAFTNLHGSPPEGHTKTPEEAPPPKFNAPLPPDVTDSHFPVTFHREKEDEASWQPLKQLTQWPARISPNLSSMDTTANPYNGPLTAHGSNTLLTQFYSGNVTIPGTETNLWGLFRQAGTPKGLQFLEDSHNVVQLVLPAREGSRFVTTAPTLSQEMVYKVQTDKGMASRYLFGVLMYLQFWGGELAPDGTIQRTKDFAERAQNVNDHTRSPHNHNRMCRMVKSLLDCGFGNLAEQVLEFIEANRQDYGNPKLYFAQNYMREHQRYYAKEGYRNVWEDGKCNYLNHFIETEPTLRKTQQPQWFSNGKFANGVQDDPVFKTHLGAAPLLVWQPEKQRWDMPHLKAPRLFCTIDQEANYAKKAPGPGENPTSS